MNLPIFVNIITGLIFIYLILCLLASEIQEIISAALNLRARKLKEGIEIMLSNSTIGKEKLVDLLYKESIISTLNYRFRKRPGQKVLGPSYIHAETFSTALLEVLNRIASDDHILGVETKEISTTIETLGLSPELKNNLKSLIDRAQKNKTTFKEEIEKWFDRSMERAGGAYKRDAKVWAIFIGFLIAISANADTLHIVSRLSKEKAINNSIDSYLKVAEQNCLAQSNNNSDKSPSCIIDDKELTKLALPIGWEASDLPFKKPQVFFLKLVGWLLTGIAISMGSSFWFDLLNKILNIRYVGRKPDEKK